MTLKKFVNWIEDAFEELKLTDNKLECPKKNEEKKRLHL